MVMEGGFIHVFICLINPSLFIKMGKSRLKMNLLYTSSPVKGHSVQCVGVYSVYLHAICYSLDAFEAASDAAFRDTVVSPSGSKPRRRPRTLHRSDKNKGITDFHQWSGGSVESIIIIKYLLTFIHLYTVDIHIHS